MPGTFDTYSDTVFVYSNPVSIVKVPLVIAIGGFVTYTLINT